MVNVLILRAAGTNCDVETEWAFKLAGASPERIHINRIIENKKLLEKYQILVIPGGFAYGDDIAAGKVLANQIKYKLWDGICKEFYPGKVNKKLLYPGIIQQGLRTDGFI